VDGRDCRTIACTGAASEIIVAIFGQYSAAVAFKEKGILSGKRIERSERGTPGEFDWIENASAEELLAFIETSVAKH
jgi:hypothetical protein